MVSAMTIGLIAFPRAKPAAILTRRHLVAAKARLAGQEVGLPTNIYESPAELRRAVAEASPNLLIVDLVDQPLPPPAIGSLAVKGTVPLLLIGASSFATIQIRGQWQGTVEGVPEPFYVEELVAKLALLVERSSGYRSVEQLTARQQEILALLATGASNEVIAQRCCVEAGTVKAHVRAITGKLGAQNRTEAVAIAKDLALL
jgi:DNA-binding CsgD family transcriptional regulator